MVEKREEISSSFKIVNGLPAFPYREIDNYPKIYKEKILEDLRSAVRDFKTKAQYPTPIDEGIRETVAMLRAFGIYTSGSCEGHPEKHAVGPYIIVSPEWPDSRNLMGTPEWQKKAKEDMGDQKNRLNKFLDEFYIRREVHLDVRISIDQRRSQDGFIIQSQNGWVRYGELLYKPGTDLWIEDGNLMFDSPSKIPQEEHLRRATLYKEEMGIFTSFLKERFLRD